MDTALASEEVWIEVLLLYPSQGLLIMLGYNSVNHTDRWSGLSYLWFDLLQLTVFHSALATLAFFLVFEQIINYAPFTIGSLPWVFCLEFSPHKSSQKGSFFYSLSTEMSEIPFLAMPHNALLLNL